MLETKNRFDNDYKSHFPHQQLSVKDGTRDTKISLLVAWKDSLQDKWSE